MRYRKGCYRPTGQTHYRVGFDTEGRTIWSSSDGTTFVPNLRHVSAAPTGDYKLYVRMQTSGGTLNGVTLGELSSAPVMNFRYIESPDGVFQYPLFATEEEANYYDANHTIGTVGTGTSHTHTFADDPTNTTWYMADTGSTMTDTSDPVGTTFQGQVISYGDYIFD